MVTGDSVGGDPTQRIIKASRAHRQREIRGIRKLLRSSPDALLARRRHSISLCRRLAAQRGHAPSDAARGRRLWRIAAESEWSAGSSGGPLEIRVQGHQVDYANPI